MSRSAAPRVLVTGFGPFPGAPVNPTEALVGRLRENPPAKGAFRADVLDVDYGSIAGRLSEIGRDFAPDIAIHFGLAQEARGFRLERLARNSYAGARPDNAGRLPETARICEGPDTLPASLPLEEIAGRLKGQGFCVEFSEDAGFYLCNTVFVLSRFHACPGLAPAMSGFVHLPLASAGLTLDEMEAGARAIVAICAAAWTREIARAAG